MPSMRNNRSASSRKHCDSPKVWVRRANPSLRPQRYCRKPANPDAAKKSDCMSKGGSWVLRKKMALKRRQGHCKGGKGVAAVDGEEGPGFGEEPGFGEDIEDRASAFSDDLGGVTPQPAYNPYFDNASDELLGRKSRKSKSKSKSRKMSHGKIKFYPKNKKSCNKRHMNWNSKTKRCNKSK